MDRYTAIVSRFSLVQRLACLAGVVAVVVALASPVAYSEQAMVGVQAVLVAAGVSLVGASVAVVLASRHRGSPTAVAWILAGDAVAMAVPLVSGTILSRQEGPLAQAGVFGWIVLFFLATLVAKTVLIAPLAQTPKSPVAAVTAAGVEAANAETTKVGA